MSIMINLCYTGVGQNARRFAEEMGTIAVLREKYDLHMRVGRYLTDKGGIPDHDAKFIKE